MSMIRNEAYNSEKALILHNAYVTFASWWKC